MENIYIVISFALILLGVAGVFFPILPGPMLVLIGIALYSYGTDFIVITPYWLTLFAILTLITITVDYLASFITAKKFNASIWGMAGMIIGGFLGLMVFNIIGLLIGQVIGLILGELFMGKELIEAIKTGSAGVVGYLISLIVKVAMTGIMLGIFIYLTY
ncbi:hypothetical protein SAMN05660297_02042 [Natronincola peptidivorans]|uniref:DUF456 domain-containing protein n=1 Tax=Natronincola peptidivorans TaxID=426128 RepID=A0A1I0DKJ7_9FIRM|nr:DUF456 domain-containing protein [Natronincola peptidivorans]SET33002.1 hypothetical protein SAMN05660297_02042 [Natronincola peptidivorans]